MYLYIFRWEKTRDLVCEATVSWGSAMMRQLVQVSDSEEAELRRSEGPRAGGPVLQGHSSRALGRGWQHGCARLMRSGRMGRMRRGLLCYQQMMMLPAARARLGQTHASRKTKGKIEVLCWKRASGLSARASTARASTARRPKAVHRARASPSRPPRWHTTTCCQPWCTTRASSGNASRHIMPCTRSSSIKWARQKPTVREEPAAKKQKPKSSARR